MRVLGRHLLLILLLIAARYAPLERAGEIFLTRKAHAPLVVTGSVAVPQSVPQRLADDKAKLRTRSQTGVILGGAQGISQGNAGPRPGQQLRARGASGRNFDNGIDEIIMGGTGLLVDGASTRPLHPLAAANPDSFVVVCEAGCRPGSDQIVYKISKTSAPAAAIAQRRLEVTAAAGEIVSAGDAVCVAGCYRDEPARRHHARLNAAPSQSAPAAKLAAVPAPKTAQSQDDLRLGIEVYRILAGAVQRPAPRDFVRLPADVVAVATAALDTRHLIRRETDVRAVKKRAGALASVSPRRSTMASTLRRTPVTPRNQRARTQARHAVKVRYAGSHPSRVRALAQLDQP